MPSAAQYVHQQLRGMILKFFSTVVVNIFLYANIETYVGSCCFGAVGTTILRLTRVARINVSVHSPYNAERHRCEEYKSSKNRNADWDHETYVNILYSKDLMWYNDVFRRGFKRGCHLHDARKCLRVLCVSQPSEKEIFWFGDYLTLHVYN